MSLDHRTLVDDKKHTPKNFGSASVGQASWKNQSGDNEYFAVSKLPDCINVVDASTAPPTEVDGDIYVLTDIGTGLGRQQINSLIWLNEINTRATFDGGHDLSRVLVGDYIYIQNSDQSIQNGRFLIIAKGSGTIDFRNPNITSGAYDESSSPSYATFGLSNFDGGTSGDWVKFNGTIWESILIGNGSSVYNLADDALYTYYLSLVILSNYSNRELNFNVTQTSTNAPTDVIIGLNAIGSISWAYTSTGVYTGTLAGAFPSNKTLCIISGLPTNNTAEFKRTSDDTVRIRTYDNGGSITNGVLSEVGCRIIVSP